MPSELKYVASEFPVFKGALKDWAYMDNAATTQKPGAVIHAISNFYTNENANIHRGLYELSTHATNHFEEVRRKVKTFIGASYENEIAFTSGTTESINIVAHSFSQLLKEGDEVVISVMEHHSNLIPWQQICSRSKALLKIIPVDPNGDLSIPQLKLLLTPHTRLIALTHISNTLGTINPVGEIIELVHQKKIPVLIDAAQSASHIPLNVSQLDVDFLAFSGHKMFGPMGTGVLYVKKKYHGLIQPLVFGGGAIRNVNFNETKLRDFPFCIEAGTPHVPGVIGLGAALDFLNTLNGEEMQKHIQHLAFLFRERLKSLSFVTVVGNPKKYGGIVTFFVNEIHAHDVASYLADKKIAVRAGHHCTQPLHEKLGLPATIRASFSIYNSDVEVDRLINALANMKKFWT